ncbi:uncharacterized protein LOC106177118 [Lingula anatina]|uniref:Uncharacterized protein LOC106177118 n=1 Tax=Lingula anatina TaxID=7574 RepID=A0A1S3JXX1_LINAN|nr:uncharacterized protein LOC106177118 [Lingula anatina]|eukprot:XP_013415260.1 uncharacterized protein LOC106177118 [Lingula anatina]
MAAVKNSPNNLNRNVSGVGVGPDLTKMKPDFQTRNNMSVSLPNLVLGSSVMSLPRVKEEEEEDIPVSPPEEELRGMCDHVDSGWSWVVMVAGAVGLFLGNGYLYSCGVFYLPLLEDLGEGDVLTSMVGSVFLGQTIISGFLASILCDKLDCRRGCMIGGLFTAAGLVGSFFASNCTHLIISFGVFTAPEDPLPLPSCKPELVWDKWFGDR